MKLKFVLDKKYDLQMVFCVTRENPKEIDVLSDKIKIDKDIFSKILFSNKKFVNIINNLIKKKHNYPVKYLKKTLKLYQKSWNEINDNFSRGVEKITGYAWKYKIYFCVLSPFHKGISNWGGNKIIRGWDENPYTMRKITAHELIISHIFTIFEKDFSKENLSNKEKWALAEICAWAITGLEKRMLKFWPWITEKEKYPLNHNHPELYELQKLLKTKYEEKKNFKEFLKESVKIIKKFEKEK